MTSDVFEEEEGEEDDDGGKCEPPATLLSSMKGIDSVRKYLMKMFVDNMMTAHRRIKKKVYRVQQKVKKQQLTLMNK
jgi:hypothetical protein